MSRKAGVTDDQMDEVLRQFGLFPSGDNREQMRVMIEAMHIYEEREAQRGGLWKESGYVDNAHHLRSKGQRVSKACSMDVAEEPEAQDEAIDAINYAVFFVRNTEAGRRGEE